MNSGRSCFGARTSAGSGWLSAAEQGKCSLTSSAVAASNGSRSEQSCRLLWERIPIEYKSGLLYTDFWAAYAEVLPKEQHRATGKGDGQTCHIERFNNVLRQRLGRFVRKTLSFSKNDQMHDDCLRLFLHEYNQSRGNTPTRHKPNRFRLI